MATPREVIEKAGVKPDMSKESGECIKELISKAFATRNLLHMAHWNSDTLASHLATGELYDSIIEDIDEIVEVYMGKYGKLSGLSTGATSVPKDICAHIKSEASWVENNRACIGCGTAAIENLVDTLVGKYHKVVYKLENLR